MSEINCNNCAVSDFKESLCHRCAEMKRLGRAEDIEGLLIKAFSEVDSPAKSDCIDRQAVIDAIVAWTVEDRPDIEMPTDLVGRIEALPSAQPETANIIVGKSRDGMTMWYQCDNCNEPVDENDLYCRGCGRRFQHGSNRQTCGD